jgi:porin
MAEKPNLLFLAGVLFFANNAIAQEQNPINFSFGGVYVKDYLATYKDDKIQNDTTLELLRGGMSFEKAYKNNIKLRGTLSTFYANDGSIGKYAGDSQGVSNIETGYAGLYLEQAWVELGYGADKNGENTINARFGQIDLNSIFDVSNVSGIFLNASHGIVPTFSGTGNNGPSIYPVFGLGAVLNLKLSDNIQYRAGVFDGVPGNLNKPNKFDWNLNGQEGALLVNEAQYSNDIMRIMVGGFNYTEETNSIIGNEFAKNHGIYSHLEINPSGNIALFGRYGNSAKKYNAIDDFYSFGMVSRGLFGFKNNNLGLAYGRAKYSDDAKSYLALDANAEHNYELTYTIPWNSGLLVQGDYQVIKNAGGLKTPDNVQVIGFRLKYNYGNWQ